MSQLDVSARTGVSTRHLSCVETGRSRASRDLLLFLSEEFEMPRRAANEMLLAAGFAPVYTEFELDDAAMTAARDVIDLIVNGNDPHPTTVIDQRWNLVDANVPALWLARDISPDLMTPPINIARMSLHPDGLAPRVRNFDEYAGQLLRHMHHVLTLTYDPVLAELLDECDGYAPGAARRVAVGPDVVLPIQIVDDGVELTFVSTVTTFGASRNVTLSELSIETLYPADETTRHALATRPWESGPSVGTQSES